MPNTAAVVITCPPGTYSQVLAKAKSNILASHLKELGVDDLRARHLITGALILEVPGPNGVLDADSLAVALRTTLATEEGVTISRPMKKADLRIKNLDESVSQEGILSAFVTCGA